MTLSLPADLEPYVEEYDEMHAPGCYALSLQRPVDLHERWHEYYDTKPPYWRQLLTSNRVLYVGASGDLLSRLEDHRDNNDPHRDSKRETVLTKVCDVQGLHTAWPCESEGEAWKLERAVADALRESHPSWFVHQR